MELWLGVSVSIEALIKQFGQIIWTATENNALRNVITALAFGQKRNEFIDQEGNVIKLGLEGVKYVRTIYTYQDREYNLNAFIPLFTAEIIHINPSFYQQTGIIFKATPGIVLAVMLDAEAEGIVTLSELKVRYPSDTISSAIINRMSSKIQLHDEFKKYIMERGRSEVFLMPT